MLLMNDRPSVIQTIQFDKFTEKFQMAFLCRCRILRCKFLAILHLDVRNEKYDRIPCAMREKCARTTLTPFDLWYLFMNTDE